MRKMFSVTLGCFVLIFSGIAGVTAATAKPSRDGQNRQIEIHNRTGTTISRIYAKSSSGTQWSTDMIPNTVISPSETESINVDNGAGTCLYDFWIVYMNDARQTLYRVDVCSLTHLDAMPDGLEAVW